jgi:hypothetical protein
MAALVLPLPPPPPLARDGDKVAADAIVIPCCDTMLVERSQHRMINESTSND